MIKSRVRLAAAAIAIAAPLVASASPAGADPVVTLPGSSTAFGQSITVTGQGCFNGAGTAYSGLFSTQISTGTVSQNEWTTNSDGTWSISTTVDASTPLGDFDIRFYCATAPVTDINDPNMTWVSGDYTYSLVAGGSRTGFSHTGRSSASTVGGARMYIDPNALPLVDKIDIVGPRAAQIKKLVDTVSGPSALASKGHNGNVKYINTAILVGGAQARTAAGMAKYVAELDAGRTRVGVDEEIALTGHTASYWNS